MFFHLDAGRLVRVEHLQQHVDGPRVSVAGQARGRVVAHVRVAVGQHGHEPGLGLGAADHAQGKGRRRTHRGVAVLAGLLEHGQELRARRELVRFHLGRQHGNGLDGGPPHVHLALVPLGRGRFQQDGQAVAGAELAQRAAEVHAQRHVVLVHAPRGDLALEDAGQPTRQGTVVLQRRAFRIPQCPGQADGRAPPVVAPAAELRDPGIDVARRDGQRAEHHPQRHEDAHRQGRQDQHLQQQAEHGGREGRRGPVAGPRRLGRRRRRV